MLTDEILKDLLEGLSEVSLGNKANVLDVLGDAYEYLIGRFADVTKRKKAGEFYTPRSVVRMMVEHIRNRGSIHSDLWVGTAADLAARSVIAVYPVSGWWKDQPKRDRSAVGAPYSLIVSIETDAEGADIWTPVALSSVT